MSKSILLLDIYTFLLFGFPNYSFNYIGQYIFTFYIYIKYILGLEMYSILKRLLKCILQYYNISAFQGLNNFNLQNIPYFLKMRMFITYNVCNKQSVSISK